MKKTLMILLLALTAITVKADDYDYLVILDNSSNATSFVSDGLTLTYNGTTLTVTPTSGNAVTFDTKSLSKIYFSSTATAWYLLMLKWTVSLFWCTTWEDALMVPTTL